MAKRSGKQLSVLVIPDDGSRTLEFKIGYWLLRGAVGTLLILLVLVATGGVFFWQARYWQGVARTYRLENLRLREEVARVEELAQMVARMKQRDQQLRDMLSPQIAMQPAGYTVPVTSRKIREDDESSRQVITVSGRSVSHPHGSVDPRWTPSIWPVSRSVGWVTREFEDRAGVLQNRHPGIDLAASEGTPVLATADGRVVFSGTEDVMGQMVAIDHNGIFLTLYGHNSALLVEEGELVRRGQPIALLGNSGQSSGPHLHYEVRQDGHPKDPRRFLPP